MKDPRGKGSYTPQACNLCRFRKIRCSGDRPICESCNARGHQCIWGGESAEIERHIEALRKRIKILEKLVESCRKKCGGLNDDAMVVVNMKPELPPIDQIGEDLGFSDHGEDSIEKLRQLVLEDQEYQLYGPTSIFQYAPSSSERRSRFPEIIEKTSQCYVLLVDGIDESAYNPDFDWSRHLPPEVPIDRREHDKLLDLVFKFFCSWCLRIVPPLFLRDMWRYISVPHSQTPPKTAHYSPMLHNSLMAIASLFSDNPRIRDVKSRQYFVQLAKSYIDKECQSPNISVVHALSVLGSFHASQGDQTLGYMYFGMAGRIGSALGLGIDCSPWVKANIISHDDMLDRNWAHWTIFCQDVCWSLYVGREFCVPDADQNIPVPFVDSDFDQLIWHHPPSGLQPQPTYLSRTFAATCELLRIGRRILAIVNLLNLPGSRSEIDLKSISTIDVQLNTWKERLLPEVEITLATRNTATPHRLMVHLTYWQFFILLHRPFYRRISRSKSELEIDHVELCNRAASNIMDLLATWRNLYTLRYIPIRFTHIVFSAGTIFLLSALRATSGVRFTQVSLEKSLSQAELCIQYLQEVGRSYLCAKSVAGILASLLQEQLKPKLAIRSQGPSRPLLHARQNMSMSEVIQSFSQQSVPPPLYDTQRSNVHQEIYPRGSGQQFRTADDQQNIGRSASSYADATNAAPRPHAANLCFGSSPMGLGMKGGGMLSNQPFMALGVPPPINYDEAFFRNQLNLPHGNELSDQPPLTDEHYEQVRQFLDSQVSSSTI